MIEKTDWSIIASGEPQAGNSFTRWIDNEFVDALYSHSLDYHKGWYQIDFKQELTVVKISVVMRPGLYHRADNVEIRVGNVDESDIEDGLMMR